MSLCVRVFCCKSFLRRGRRHWTRTFQCWPKMENIGRDVRVGREEEETIIRSRIQTWMCVNRKKKTWIILPIIIWKFYLEDLSIFPPLSPTLLQIMLLDSLLIISLHHMISLLLCLGKWQLEIPCFDHNQMH